MYERQFISISAAEATICFVNAAPLPDDFFEEAVCVEGVHGPHH